MISYACPSMWHSLQKLKLQFPVEPSLEPKQAQHCKFVKVHLQEESVGNLGLQHTLALEVSEFDLDLNFLPWP